jgi:branched-chain amino acid transport system permease protein
MVSIQVILNIIYSASVYFLVALSFMLIYNVTKFFNLAHAIILTLGPYFTLLFLNTGLPAFIAIILSIVFSGIIGVGFEAFIFNKLRSKLRHPYVFMVCSLGIYIVFQNIISIIWGDATQSIRIYEIQKGIELFGGYITKTQIISILIIALLSACVIVSVSNSKLGKEIRAISSNNVLSRVYGINLFRVILITVGISSILAALAGIIVAFDSDMVPAMGFNLLLYGIVVMIIGGVGNFYGLIGGSLLLATSQNIGAYYIDTKWMDAITYIILILFIIWKPLGFTGKQLKKIEI